MKHRTKLAALAAATSLLVLPAASLGQSPTTVQYGTPVETIGVVAGVQAAPPAPPAPPAAATVGALPFTGAELRILSGAGILLLGAGLFLRRVGFARSNR
jgi:hypothetical protein